MEIEKIKKDGITNNEEYTSANELLKKVREKEKELKAQKDELLKPIVAHEKQLRAKFKPAEEKLASMKSVVIGAIFAYDAKIKAESMKKLAESTDPLADIEAIIDTEQVKSEVKLITRTVVEAEVSKMDIDYVLELVNRPKVFEAFMVEVRKDHKDGRKEKGVSSHNEKVAR